MFPRLVACLFLLGGFCLKSPLAAVEWRDMLREQLRLEKEAADLSQSFPGMAPAMARLGEAFALTAYADDVKLGRKNFSTLVRNLGMTHPTPAELRQFLHPNKNPWTGYQGPTNGNFHMLFNSGSLSLDTSDGCSKDHPVFSLRRRFSVSASRVRPLMQMAATTIRQEKVETARMVDDTALRAAFFVRLNAAWEKNFPGKKLSPSELDFVAAMLPYLA